MIKILKYVFYAGIIVGAVLMLAAMFIDASDTPLAETLAKIGLIALIAGVALYIPLIIKEKFGKKK